MSNQATPIKRLPTKRDTLIAYTLDGHVSANDIASVNTELLAIYKQHPKVDLLVKMKSFDGFDWRAIWTDTTYAVKTQSLNHIRRYAIVGAPSWMETMINMTDPMFQVQMKSFKPEQEDEAWAWLDEEL